MYNSPLESAIYKIGLSGIQLIRNADGTPKGISTERSGAAA
jgi:hypothetical protein